MNSSSIQYLFGLSVGDEELLESLEASGQWDEGRTWARQLDSGGQRTSSALHHVTETQVFCLRNSYTQNTTKVQCDA